MTETRTITIGLSKPKKYGFHPFSWIIKYGETFEHFVKTKEWKLQKESHAYVRWNSNVGATCTYHASGNKIHFLCDEVFQDTISTVKTYNFEISKESYRDLIRFCMSNAGKKYGTKGIFGLIYVKVTGLFGIKKSNPFSDGKSTMWCSELAGYVLKEIVKIPEADNIDWEKIGVRDLRVLLDEMEGK